MRLSSLACVASLLVFTVTACSMGDDGSAAGGDGDGAGGGAGNAPSLTGANAGSSGGDGSSGGGGGSSGGSSGGPSSPTDGKQNGTETDADCGGANAPKCADGKGCAAATDCESGVCSGGKCAAPSGSDGVKNGDESDVDCGGTTTGAPKCAAGKTCAAHADCASDGCGYDKKCALAPSCAGHFGGDTCGEGEVGDPGAKHESCCAAAPIPGNATMLLDKYKITSGRFRQFMERTKGDVRTFVASLGNTADWKQAWNTKVSSNMAEANFLLGPTGNGTRAGCDLDASRGRTYWMSDAENAALGETGTHPFSKDVLDQKMLNCVDFYMLEAFCIWDGGRLAKTAEYQAAWKGGENRKYPWGGTTLDTTRVNWKYSYSFPEVYDKGNFVFVGAPGRFPGGNAKNGHADLAGLAFEILADVNGDNIVWSGSGSWEGHAVLDSAQTYGQTAATRAYWATGGRCARPAK